MRLLIAVLITIAALPAAASAQDPIERAATALRQDPVYVDPRAELADRVDADALRARIRETRAAPIYIAALPADAAATPEEALLALHDAVGLSGTYAVVAGNSFRAGSDVVSGAGREASVAAQASQGDLQLALEDFVGRVGDLRAGRQPAVSGGGSGFFGIALLILLALFAGLFLLGRRQARRRQDVELAEVKENTRDDLVALGDDIRALDLDVQMPDADPAAREDYARAVEAYDRANRVFETARRPEDLQPAAEALEAGRYAMTAAKARLAGRRPPEHRAPCFFDPRHGPSTRDVVWAPAGGTARPVPACEADALRVEYGEDPHAREVIVGGQRMPYWQAGPAYAPFYGGFFGGFGGVLPGFLLGSMIGGAWGHHPGADFGGGDFGGFGGGDFGGGGFGGGGFGGGDF